MICCVCTGSHHAMACPTAAPTLFALGMKPWIRQPPPGHDGFVAVHDAVVAEGQRLWSGRRSRPVRVVVEEQRLVG